MPVIMRKFIQYTGRKTIKNRVNVYYVRRHFQNE